MLMIVSKHKSSFKVNTDDYIVSLDCNSKDSDFNFVSHAHTDHLFKTDKNVICSDETYKLSKLRGYEFNRLNLIPNNISLVDSGHIFGSKSLIIDDDEKLVFTGDFSTKKRSFINSFKPIKCDKLIIESTFGKPEFIFPNQKEEMKKAKDFVKDNIRKDYLTIFMGYPLGKIQELQHEFRDFSKSAHEKIVPYNNVFKDFGVDLGSNVKDSQILFCPNLNSRDSYFNSIKRKTGVKFGVFSGWNIMPFYKSRFNADKGFTVSDHADFKELLNVVKKSKANEVYIHHGFKKEFSDFLKIEGINVK